MSLPVENLDKRAFAALIDFPLSRVKDRMRPAEQPLGFLRAHVDAAMAHRHAKVIVPVCAVQGMAHIGEEAGPRDAGEHVSIRVGQQISRR